MGKIGRFSEIDVMWEDTLIETIYIKDGKVSYKRYVEEPIKTAFGVNKNPTYGDFVGFLEERCVPRTRAAIDLILDAMGLMAYNPFNIVEITHGALLGDFNWIRFADERGKITYADIKRSLEA